MFKSIKIKIISELKESAENVPAIKNNVEFLIKRL